MNHSQLLIYLIDVIQSILFIANATLVVSMIVLAALFILLEKWHFCLELKRESELKYVLIAFVVSLVITLFVPNKETLLGFLTR